jgi:hypothetical protein
MSNEADKDVVSSDHDVRPSEVTDDRVGLESDTEEPTAAGSEDAEDSEDADGDSA